MSKKTETTWVLPFGTLVRTEVNVRALGGHNEYNNYNATFKSANYELRTVGNDCPIQMPRLFALALIATHYSEGGI